MQQQQKPMTSSELLEKTTNLINSVKSLEKDFEIFLSDKEIGDDVDKLIEYQNQFWNEKVSRIADEITQNESDTHIAEHCRELWDNCFLTSFYNEKIFGDWSDLELRKLTILIGIHNLKKHIEGHATEIEAQINDDEPEYESEAVDSSAIEISETSQNVHPDWEHTASDNDEPKNAENDSKTPSSVEASNLSQNSQSEILSALSDAEAEYEEWTEQNYIQE